MTDPDELGKRLIVAMDLGIMFRAEDGHIWIESDNGESGFEMLFTRLLSEFGIELNNKIYGGILEALDTIDECFRMMWKPSLLEQYAPERHFLGTKRGPDMSRIKRVEPGEGGLV